MRPATVNAQVAAMLMLRAAAFEDEEDREAAQAELRWAVEGWQKLTAQGIASESWGLGAKAAKRAGAAQRVPQERISVECPGRAAGEEETSLQLLTQLQDTSQESLWEGTRSALLSGACRYNGSLAQQWRDPHLALGPNSWILHASADVWSRLQAGCALALRAFRA